MILGTAAIIGGLASSALAAFDVTGSLAGRIGVAVLGVLAGIAAGINQFMRPARRAAAYRRAALELNREGWFFVLDQSPYRSDDPEGSWQLFISRVIEEETLADVVLDAAEDSPLETPTKSVSPSAPSAD